MGSQVQFRILGPLEVLVDGRRVPLRGPRQERALAALLLEAGRATTFDQLTDAVWEDPPASARRQIQDLITSLRRTLTAHGARRDLIATERAGYALRLAPGELDAHRFEQLVSQARGAAATEPPAAARTLRRALELCRGRTLAGIDARPLEPAVARWEERRLAVTEECLTLELDGGHHHRLVDELLGLVREHPLRERLVELLMLALHRSGRSPEALEAYQQLRRRLHEELGLDPGGSVQELHRAILRGEATPAPPALPVPAQLPLDVPGFTGRRAELAWLDITLDSGIDTVPVAVISGTAGVGKTALAVRWARTVRDRFPDGQLYVNLRGYHPEQPMPPADALAGFLAALGVVGADVPQGLDDRAARYRSETADRRMLILLDNAHSVEQVRPLLPGGDTTVAVVTSRDSLAGLVAVHGAHRLDLDRLPPDEALALLRRLIGERVDAGPEAAATLAEQCAWLPLALRVAAELAVSRPAAPLAKLVLELEDRQRRLDLLDGGGDPHAAVRVVFSWSLQHLPDEATGMFGLLGLHPGPDFDPYAAAALAGTDLEAAHRILAQLARAHLVHSNGLGRYGMHDLLRAYALQLGAGDDPGRRQSALDRLFEYYRRTASLATGAAYPYEREQHPPVPPALTPTPALPDPETALGWLDTELPNLLATAGYATDHGSPAQVLHLSAVLHQHLRTRGRYHEAETLHHQALSTARATGERAGQLAALNSLGNIYLRQTRQEQAAGCYRQALGIARAIADPAGELEALGGLGYVHLLTGRYEQAAEHYERVLRLATATGHRVGELDALSGLGHVHLRHGRHEQAAEHYERALLLARATGHRIGELNALQGVAGVHRLQGRYEQAAEHFGQMLLLARATGHRAGELTALAGLGHLHRQQRRFAQASDHYGQLLRLTEEGGDRNWQFEARQGLGRLAVATGRPKAAITHHEQALLIATELGQPDDQARAHDGLARAHHALDRHEQARDHWQRALDILTSLGIDHSDDEEASVAAIRAQLAGLG
jgi:DNA-binding SARP family transcriptional activator/tetratricopeptide (TPR) repeat protein